MVVVGAVTHGLCQKRAPWLASSPASITITTMVLPEEHKLEDATMARNILSLYCVWEKGQFTQDCFSLAFKQHSGRTSSLQTTSSPLSSSSSSLAIKWILRNSRLLVLVREEEEAGGRS